MAADKFSINLIHTDEDIKSVSSLARDIWTQHYSPIIGIDQVNYMLDKFQSSTAIAEQIKLGYQYYLVKNQHSDLGYLSIRQESDSLFISKIYVREAYRGQSIGKELMNIALTAAAQYQLPQLRLTVNKYNSSSITAYEKMGFYKKREVVFNIGNGYIMDDYEMVKELP